MKKGYIIAAVVALLLVTTLLLSPFLFRDALLEKTKSTINKNLRAEVSFDDFRLSVIRNFPKAAISLRNVVITGEDSFAGDTLLHIKSLSSTFGLFDLLTPGNLTLNELIIDDARLMLQVNEKELANWDIFPEEEESTSPAQEGSESSFGMELNKIVINHSQVTYTDLLLPLFVGFNDINLALKGDMYGSSTRLKAEGAAGQFNLIYDSVSYIADKRLTLKSALDINFDTWNFRFGESELLVNELPLAVDGTFSIPGDSILFDLRFVSKVSELADFLSLVPTDYEHYLKDLRAKGKADLSGSFKGFNAEESYPALNLMFRLSDGNLQYAGLPEEIRNVSAKLAITKPQGGFELTSLRISDAHAEVRNNPLDLSLGLDNLLGDMRFAGNLTGKVNFDHLKDAIPMDSVLVSGLLDVNIGVAGNMSAIENKRYEQIKTDGIIALNNFSYESNKLTMPVAVHSGNLDFAPERVNLRQMDVKIGQSDFALAGSVSDYYPYLFDKGNLTGNVSLKSDFLNLNELMGMMKPAGSDASPTKQPPSGPTDDTLSTAPSSFEVPERMNLTLQTDVSKVLYDRLNISNIKGQIQVNNGKLDLKGLNMNIMDGELKLAGTYQNTPEKSPLVNLSLDLVSFDIPTAFRSLKLVRNYIPIAAQSKGKFTTSIQMKGQLDENMGLRMGSLNGYGSLNTMNLQILNSPVFNKIKSVLNEERLRDLKIDDFAASFTIENGNLLLKPFKTKISEQEATFSGKLNAENLIDMSIDFMINRDALSTNVQNTIGILPGQQNIKVIPVAVAIKGPVNNPEVKIDLTEAKRMVKKEVGSAAKEEIQKSINKIGEGLKKLFK